MKLKVFYISNQGTVKALFCVLILIFAKVFAKLKKDPQKFVPL